MLLFVVEVPTSNALGELPEKPVARVRVRAIACQYRARRAQRISPDRRWPEMRINPIMCSPGYPLSGGTVAFKAEHKPAIQAVRTWQRLGGNGARVLIQTVTVDVPDHRSALSSERRT
jgi:hypothetical protein